MPLQQQVDKPQQRNRLRKFLGKNFFILKRHGQWFLNGRYFAKTKTTTSLPYSLIQHRSFLLRPLKNVDMYLQHNKVVNLKNAIQHLNKIIIQPGEIFSFWYLVGKPTASKGYLEGLTLDNGNISKGIGGGLCQLGNFLYWMALHTPLTIKERWRHSYDVFPDINRTIPFACGATLFYNYVDFQLQNNTNENFQIHLWLDDEYLNGEITCNTDLKIQYKVYETDHLFQSQWWGGYTRHNKIWRKITDLHNNYISEELIAENHAIMMYEPLIGEE